MNHSFIKAASAFAIIAAGLMFSSCKSNSNKAAAVDYTPEVISNGLYKHNSQNSTLYWISDTPEARMNQVSLFPNAPEGAAEELGITEGIPSSMSSFLLQTEGKNILFDTGMGGQLIPSLGLIGVTPDKIDMIFITHLHGDHTGGLSKDGAAVFSNAKLYLAQQEYDAFKDQEGTMAALAPYSENMVLFQYSDALPCGLKAIQAKGHTPGHTLYRKDDILIAGDIMHGVALQIAYPEANARYDQDQENAVASRKMVLNMAQSEKLLLCGMHFPEGGVIDYRQ